MPPPLHGRKRKRRRKNQSDWLHFFQQSRSTARISVESRSSLQNTLQASPNHPGPRRAIRNLHHTTAADLPLPAPNTEDDQDVSGNSVNVGSRVVRPDDNCVAAEPQQDQRESRGPGPVLDIDEGSGHDSSSNDDHFRLPNADDDNEGEIGCNHIRNDDNVYHEHPVEQKNEQCSHDKGTSPATSDSDGRTASESADMDKLQRLRKIWERSRNFTAVVSVVGSVRYTVNQYNLTRDLLGEEKHSVPMPPYKKAHQYFTEVLTNCLPCSIFAMLPSKAVAPLRELSNLDNEHIFNIQDGDGKSPNPSEATCDLEKVRIFFPSSWATLDVATPTVFHEMYPGFPEHP